MCQTWPQLLKLQRKTAAHTTEWDRGGKGVRESSRIRGEERAHHPSAHDVKWEAQPGALNPLSAGSVIQSQPPPDLPRHQHGREM